MPQENAASYNAGIIRGHFGTLGKPEEYCPKIGLILGTGWGDALPLNDRPGLPLTDLMGFGALGDLPGHSRRLIAANFGGHEVIVQSGRVHLNENWGTDIAAMVRLQITTLLELGVRTLILTAAVGSLAGRVPVGGVCVIDGFLTIFSQTAMPLVGGEFVSPEDTLDPGLREIAQIAAYGVALPVREGGHAFVRGPFFEGRRYDKAAVAAAGVKVVGMSILPEACVAALYPGVKVLGLGYVTNDDIAEHAHGANVAAAKTNAGKLGALIEGIVSRL
jgi:purine nucleoside phosphorylase